MPYIRRKKGKIVATFFSPQANDNGEILRDAEGKPLQEYLPDDDPEIIEFRKRHPMLEVKPLTQQQIKVLEKEWDRLGKEQKLLRDYMVTFSDSWSQMEIALSCLLYKVLNIKPKSSHLAYAIYYSPSSFDARSQLIDKTLRLFIDENPETNDIIKPWTQLINDIRKIRNIRNRVAHGSPLNLHIRGKAYARIAPPAFDTNLIGGPAKKGTIPGLSVSEMELHIKTLRFLHDRIDDVNRAINSFHENDEMYKEKVQKLKQNLQTKDPRK